MTLLELQATVDGMLRANPALGVLPVVVWNATEEQNVATKLEVETVEAWTHAYGPNQGEQLAVGTHFVSLI